MEIKKLPTWYLMEKPLSWLRSQVWQLVKKNPLCRAEPCKLLWVHGKVSLQLQTKVDLQVPALGLCRNFSLKPREVERSSVARDVIVLVYPGKNRQHPSAGSDVWSCPLALCGWRGGLVGEKEPQGFMVRLTRE